VTTAAAPAAFGFRIQSPYPLRFLRQGGGVEPLTILPAEPRLSPPNAPPIAEWKVGEGARDTRARLYRRGDAFQLQTEGGFAYLIEPRTRTIRVMHGADDVFWEPGVWGLPALLCFQERGDFSLHAAAVEVNGAAILLAAPGRGGKTTLALAFHRRGFRVLSEDLACCRLAPQPVLLPGPAVLRPRRDVYDGTPPPGTHLVAARPDRIYLELDDARRGGGSPVPIAGIVLLHDGVTSLHAAPLATVSALPHLWALSFGLPAEPFAPLRFRQLSRLLSATRVWALHRPLSRASLSQTVDCLLHTCAS